MTALLDGLHRAARRGSSAGAAGWAAIRRLGRDRRGSIALVMAFATPTLVMAVGMGVEVSHWTVVKLQLQRTADLAALAGATEYALTGSARNAADAAASVAELNGAAGSATRTWNEGSKLLGSGQITAQVTSSNGQGPNVVLKVVVSQTVPLVLTRIMSSLPSVAIGATGSARLGTSPQPCVLALREGGSGVSATGVTTVVLKGCAVRSNAGITASGVSHITASAFYATKEIFSTSITSSIIGDQYSKTPSILDPYAKHSPLQAALGTLKPDEGIPFSPTGSSAVLPPPGSIRSRWTIGGVGTKITLAPGIYYVNGDVNIGGVNVSLSGVGVTIVISGSFKINGVDVSINLAAAETSKAQGGAIPGIVLAGNKYDGNISIGGVGNSVPLTGVVYYPYGKVSFGGVNYGVGNECLQVIAASVEFSGVSSLAADCAKYGALSFASSGVNAIALVQ